MALISIVVPIYNTERFLSECIESLINQTYKDIEIILVNDGSTDKSLDICFEYKKKDTRINVIDQVNKGVSAARNKGIDLACGNYITFVDSDDYVESDYCEKMLEAIKKHNVDFVYFGQFSSYNNRLSKIRTRIKDGVYQTNHILKLIVDDGTMCGFLLHSTCAVLYKLDMINKYKIRFDELISHNEDGYFNLIYSLNSRLLYTKQSESIYIYRVNEKSASRQALSIETKYEILHERIENLDRIYPQYDFNLQLQKRYLTLVLQESINLILLPKEQWVNQIRKLLNNERFKKSIEVLDKDAINLNKKIILLLFSRGKVELVYFIIKYLKPILKRMKRK